MKKFSTFKSIVWLTAGLALLIACQQDSISDQWLDQSPHKTGFIPVNGITLQYLDWGGSGEVLLFLTGIGNSAHIFDEFAPRFTKQYQVLGLTRRGHGQSDAPPDGYDTGTLAEDIKAFLDQLNIEKAHLAGHSYAGSEMSRLATVYPERLHSLIYLDAGFDYVDFFEEFDAHYPDEANIRPEDLISRESLGAWINRALGFQSDAFKWELNETGQLTPDSVVQEYQFERVVDHLMGNLVKANPVYSAIEVPVLSMYGIGDGGFSDAEPSVVNKMNIFTKEIADPWKIKNMERMKSEVKDIKIVLLDSTHHYMFLQRPDRVEREIRQFLSDL